MAGKRRFAGAGQPQQAHAAPGLSGSVRPQTAIRRLLIIAVRTSAQLSLADIQHYFGNAPRKSSLSLCIQQHRHTRACERGIDRHVVEQQSIHEGSNHPVHDVVHIWRRFAALDGPIEDHL
jgi:hypothetical protein